jgi:hypothetical protein
MFAFVRNAHSAFIRIFSPHCLLPSAVGPPSHFLHTPTSSLPRARHADSFYENKYTTAQSAFFVCIAILGVTLLCFASVAVLMAFSNNVDKNGVLIRCMRLLAALIMGPLFIPMVGTFFSQVRCPVTMPAGVCNSASFYIYAVIGCVLVVVQAAFCYLLAATWFSRLPIDEGLQSRPDSALARWTIVAKTVLTCLFIALTDVSASWAHWVLIAVMLFCFFGLLVLVAWVCRARFRVDSIARSLPIMSSPCYRCRRR